VRTTDVLRFCYDPLVDVHLKGALHLIRPAWKVMAGYSTRAPRPAKGTERNIKVNAG
jgi:hypothetical protein